VRIGALKSALSLFVKEGRLIVIDKIDLAEIKTKALAAVLSKLQIVKKALVVDDKTNENLKLSIRNMDDHQYLPPEGVNVYDLLRHDHLVVSKDAAKALEARCLK
jgi:large subunit ribosomal protein L4